MASVINSDNILTVPKSQLLQSQGGHFDVESRAVLDRASPFALGVQIPAAAPRFS